MDRRKIERIRQRGLTLVELLVVIVILALASTVVLLTAPPSRPPVREDAERFAARMQIALDAAIMSGDALRLSVDGKGYVFEVLRRGEWTPAEGAKILSRSDFDSRTTALLEMSDASFNNARALGVEEADRTEEEEEAVRLIALDPLGAQPAFSMRFSSGDGVWTVTVDEAAEVSVKEDA